MAAGNPIPESLHKRAEARRTLGDKQKPLTTDVAQYFPDRFVFNEKVGWMPEGWETSSIYAIAKFINGAAFKNSQFVCNKNALPVVKIAELKKGISAQTKYIDQTLDQKYFIDSKEILFSWSGNPDTSIDTFIWSHGPAWLNQHIFKVVLHHARDRSFVYYLLRHLKPTFSEIARDKQTTGLGHVTVGDMKKLYIIKPNSFTLDSFTAYAEPLMKKWFKNSMQNRELSNLRDTLLPQLLSGQLRIPNAENFLK